MILWFVVYSYVIVWYAMICCDGTLVTPYLPLPSQRLKCSLEIWGSTVSWVGPGQTPAANAFRYILNT